MEEVSNFWPAMAVPTMVKMPEPTTAPMPSAVSDHGPRVFLSRCSGRSESEMSLSMDFLANSWLGSLSVLSCGMIGNQHSALGIPPIWLSAECRLALSLRRAARQLFHLALERSPGSGALGLG